MNVHILNNLCVIFPLCIVINDAHSNTHRKGDRIYISTYNYTLHMVDVRNPYLQWQKNKEGQILHKCHLLQ